MKKNILVVISFTFFFVNNILAQSIGIGEWRTHLPYRKCIAVDISGIRFMLQLLTMFFIMINLIKVLIV